MMLRPALRIASRAAVMVGFILLTLQVHAETVLITPDDCLNLTIHQPLEDVAYKPGVAADGSTVVPADLEDTARLDLPAHHEYWLEISVPLEEVIDIDADSSLERVRQSELGVGTVTVSDGQAYFNGTPLGSQNTHALAEACANLQEGSLVETP
jgi:hypothetical protein